MGLLCFDKPKKALSTEEHNAYFSSDTLIPGTYAPNMSQKDREKWKGKITGTKRGKPQVEIRKDSFVTIVGLKGYKYKHYDETEWNIHVAAAGPIQMTFKGWEEWKQVVEEAKEILANL